MQEDWVDIEGYGGAFKINKIGDVLSVKRGKLLKHSKNSGGYISVSLYKNGKTRSVLHHRLIAAAFIPNTDNKPHIHHINGNKSDNRIENLVWVTEKEHGTLKLDEQKERFRNTYRKNMKIREGMKHETV